MFAEATRITSRQVMYILGAFRFRAAKKAQGTKVRTSVAASILVNEDGWVLTCKHVIEGIKALVDEEQRSRKWEAISADPHLSPAEKNRQFRQLARNRRLTVRRWCGDSKALLSANSISRRLRTWLSSGSRT